MGTKPTGNRLSFKEALDLYRQENLLTLGDRADKMRARIHPENKVTYVVDRNVNYTNVCSSGCRFCAFFRPIEHPEAYVISREALARKIAETVDLGGTQILLQGGMHPELGLEYFERLLNFIKGFSVHVHGLSPPEIYYLSEKENLSLETILKRLVKAGLGSIPGGGAEILVERVRKQISPRKCTADQWLEVMEVAHGLGLRTTATMMFGHIETHEERLKHLFRIRDLQDRTKGFTAFIPWTFQPDNTRLNVRKATSVEYLRLLALSRLVLDNVPNIQASWVTQGAKIAQVALKFGANDLGSTMIEENVVAAAGVSFRLTLEDMLRIIETAGFYPQQRDTFYRDVDKLKGGAGREENR